MRCPRCMTGTTRSMRVGSPASSNSTTSPFPMTASGRRSRTSPSPRCPARPSRWPVRPGPDSSRRSPFARGGSARRGKSTAIALLHRAFDPQSGFIRIDGMDVRGVTLTSLRRNIGVVFQEALLFNRSIAENLRVGKPDATEAEMRKAAERAQALEFIDRSGGFETNAGERGRMLSGGERQRLSIARALLKDPPILILDEATSALDAVTEAKVNTALDEVMKGRTTFVIAHRLSTIRNATQILVFENGRVIESGTFDELVVKGGHFADLAKAQFMVQEDAQAALLART